MVVGSAGAAYSTGMGDFDIHLGSSFGYLVTSVGEEQNTGSHGPRLNLACATVLNIVLPHKD
jgi:hypothetical protein